MKKLKVNTGRKYDIIIDRGIIDKCGEYIKKVISPTRVTVVTDSNVHALYSQNVIASLKQSGFIVSEFVFKAGEASKNFRTIEAIYSHLADNNITRKDIILALGGGVTGDMAGFAAATYLRGIEFVQIPTSLLAQVDSSVGGKTGYDIKQGKNLVGAFWQPSLVLIDPNTLSTLPERYVHDGMAEVIKYGCIKSLGLFRLLKKGMDELDIENIIYRCVSIKRDIVQRDETEAGERKLLNFGHTIGHALEKIYDYKGLSHGEAVAIGMVMITNASEKEGFTPKGTTQKIIDLCKLYHLPIHDDSSMRDIAFASQSDKKSFGSGIDIVVLKAIGDATVKNIDHRRFQEYIDVTEEV
ncbi:MAG: 3-dehydroquinate synthase [Oscillospiraceae bacterium]|nr:3-dehydroquinate synthase [Oscillospiraceae bacterium]